MTKLYLIRRNLDTFIGPYSAAEIKEAFQKMQFGLQDEISGHCGPWIPLESTDKIRKAYPEIARLIFEDMQSWGVSSPEAIKVTGSGVKELRSTKSSIFSGLGWAIALLLIAALALASAIYFAVTGKTIPFPRDSETPFLFEELKSIADKQDGPGISRFVEKHLVEITDRITRAKKPELQWLPYVRHYAFGFDNLLGNGPSSAASASLGAIDGLPMRFLRGDNLSHIPMDCSEKAWLARWRGAIRTLNEMVTQARLVNSHWARLLSWDPHWIRRREHKGWLSGESYFLGCTYMAEQALKEIFADPSVVTNSADWEKLGLNKVKTRLNWILEVQKSGLWSNQPTMPQANDLLSLWTCYESALEIKHLAQCRDAYTGGSDENSASYSDERFGWNLIRLILGARGNLPNDVIQAMNQLLPKIQKGDQYNKFDYRFEIKLWRALLKQPTNIEKIIEKSLVESPEIHL
jgi:hypothetical protein